MDLDFIIDELNDMLLCEEVENQTHIIKTKLYPMIESVLSTPIGDRQFKLIIGKYIDKNSEKLHTSGPVYLIPFADLDKQQIFNLFNIKATFTRKSGKQSVCVTSIDPIIKELIGVIKSETGSTSDFHLLTNNHVFWIFYCCIRYYTLKKDPKGLNSALAIYALSVYPSVFSLFFKYGTDEAVMQYTIDNLSNKYLIKQGGSIFNGLVLSIQHSYEFFKNTMNAANDKDIIRFIQRIHNDQKSMIKNVCDQYMKNYKAGNRVTLNKDNYDEVQLDTEVENNTSVVEILTNNITNQIITNSIDLKRVSIVKEIAQISLSECRFYISKIVTSEYANDIQKFIHSILFMFLYIDHHEKSEINSGKFLTWADELFRKTNSNNDNIRTIKETLDKWGEETGIHAKFQRDGSRISYKRAIYFYFVLSIQYYNK